MNVDNTNSNSYNNNFIANGNEFKEYVNINYEKN